LDAVAVASHSFPKNATLRRELLERYPHAAFNETGRPLRGAGLVDFLRGHTKAITGLEVLDDELFRAVPELRLVSKYGVGLDMIDLDAARRHGVEIRWTAGVNRQAVAELTIAMMIALCRRMVALSVDMRDGGWHQPGGRQLSTATVGIIGCGHVGKEVARICRAFGSTLLAYDIVDYAEFYARVGVEPVPFSDLLARADIVTIHTPLDASTRGMIGATQIAAMKPTAFLVNTARGAIVDEDAVYDALTAHRLGGAAFDVFENEPPRNLDLLRLPSVVATPHIGGSTTEAVLAMGRAAIAGLDRAGQSIDLTQVRATPKK
jgi:D-3-phosphoglycerate dehydrogenase